MNCLLPLVVTWGDTGVCDDDSGEWEWIVHKKYFRLIWMEINAVWEMYMFISHSHHIHTKHIFIDPGFKGHVFLRIPWIITLGLSSVSCSVLMYPDLTFLTQTCILYFIIDNFCPTSWKCLRVLRSFHDVVNDETCMVAFSDSLWFLACYGAVRDKHL